MRPSWRLRVLPIIALAFHLPRLADNLWQWGWDWIPDRPESFAALLVAEVGLPALLLALQFGGRLRRVAGASMYLLFAAIQINHLLWQFGHWPWFYSYSLRLHNEIWMLAQVLLHCLAIMSAVRLLRWDLAHPAALETAATVAVTAAPEPWALPAENGQLAAAMPAPARRLPGLRIITLFGVGYVFGIMAIVPLWHATGIVRDYGLVGWELNWRRWVEPAVGVLFGALIVLGLFSRRPLRRLAATGAGVYTGCYLVWQAVDNWLGGGSEPFEWLCYLSPNYHYVNAGLELFIRLLVALLGAAVCVVSLLELRTLLLQPPSAHIPPAADDLDPGEKPGWDEGTKSP